MDESTHALTAEVLGRRWAAALRRRFPGPGAAKRIAEALGADPRTVEGWLEGRAAYPHVLFGAAVRLRDPLMLFELAGIEPPGEAAIAANLERMRADLDQLGGRIRMMRGDG